MTYPTFAGKDEEDFFKFEKELKDAFRQNRVQRGDQAKKLKENLQGQAKRMIPSNNDNIDDCLSILKSMYADPAKLTRARKNKLEAMGPYPRHGSKAPGHVRQQVEWLLQVELTLKDLSDLAAKDANCYCEVYNTSMLQSVKNFFPHAIHTDLNRKLNRNAPVKEQLDVILSHVETMREEQQELFKDVGGVNTGADFDKDNKKPGVAGAAMGPTRNENCRVCELLDNDGDTDQLYDDHYSPQLNGCPKFASMSFADRKKTISKAEFCMFCLDVNYHHKGGRHHGCAAFQKSMSYTCRASGCKKHWLICEDHHSENKDNIERSKKFWSSRGKTFSTSVLIFQTATSSEPSANNQCCARPLMEASQKLKRLARGSLIRDIPAGDPMFMFSYYPGKSRDLLSFYDLGCSHLLMDNDVPSEVPSVRIREGPIMLNAATDVTVQADGEWAILLKRTDGSQQICVGLSCTNVTSEFPRIDLTEAKDELFTKCPEDKKHLLSNISVPDMIGGARPDLLIGIFYNCIQPETLFCLPSGLFLAKLKLASSGNFNAVIGGPHVSFSRLANHVGGDYSRLMAHFVQEIKDFAKFGAPKLPAPMLSFEDLHAKFVKMMNKDELADIVEIIEDEDDYEEIETHHIKISIKIDYEAKKITAILNIAEQINTVNPCLAEMLIPSRILNDIADSVATTEDVKMMIAKTDELFASVGPDSDWQKGKPWMFEYNIEDAVKKETDLRISDKKDTKELITEILTQGNAVSEERVTKMQERAKFSNHLFQPSRFEFGKVVRVTSLVYKALQKVFKYKKLQIPKTPALYFGRKKAGKLTIGSQTFSGTFSDLKNLSRRQVVSKFASVFDPQDRMLPVTSAMKVHIRCPVLETLDWQGFLSENLRETWIENFLRLEKLRKLQFSRAVVSIGAGDASNELKVEDVYGRFKIKLSCEHGTSACLILDQETSFMKTVRVAEIKLKDLSLRAYKEDGIKFEVVPVSGHNYTGLNNDANNASILKIVTPNIMKIGHLHPRSLDETNDPKEYLKKVEDTCQSFKDIFNTAMLPKLIPQPKWFKDSIELKPEDLVYFQKTQSSEWTLGQIELVTKSKDQVVKRVSVRYFNDGEKEPLFTDRAACSIVRPFSIDDNYFVEDMAAVERMLSKVTEANDDKVEPLNIVRGEDGQFKLEDRVNATASYIRTCNCCCDGHCALAHIPGTAVQSSAAIRINHVVTGKLSYAPVLLHPDDTDLEDADLANHMLPFNPEDEIFAMVTALHTNFNEDGDTHPHAA